LTPSEVETNFYPGLIGPIRGVAWNPVIGPRVTLLMVRTIDSLVQSPHSQLPSQHYHMSNLHSQHHIFHVSQPDDATSLSYRPRVMLLLVPRHRMDFHINFHTVPRVNFLLVQLDPENAKFDCHMACPSAATCHADIMLTSSATCHADVLLTSVVQAIDLTLTFCLFELNFKS
jgi:hypothetical protein